MSRGDHGRSGFTIIELLVAVVAGLVLLAGVFQVLLGSQRLYSARQLEIQGRQTQLAGSDVLFGELREISPSSGDIIAMSSTSIQFRAQRKFALTCGINYTLGELDILPWGPLSRMAPGDSIFVFADADIETGTDDTWHATVVADTATTTCFAQAGQTLSVPAVLAAMLVDSVRVGAPMRSFERYTYSLGQDGGDWFLMRQLDGGSAVPMVGPLLSSQDGGLALTYQDQNGNTTNVPAQVAQVGITLRTGADARASAGGLVRDSISTLVSLRN